jgi:hypothetical protein
MPEEGMDKEKGLRSILRTASVNVRIGEFRKFAMGRCLADPDLHNRRITHF